MRGYLTILMITTMCACEGSSDAELPLVEGGGYRSASEGLVVGAIDAFDGTALENARVFVDGTMFGLTGSSGAIEVDASVDSLIEVEADGYRSSRTFGAAGVVTLPLQPMTDTFPVHGQVEGLESLTVPEGADLLVRVRVAQKGSLSLSGADVATCRGETTCEFDTVIVDDVPARWFAQIDALFPASDDEDDEIVPLAFAASDEFTAVEGLEVTLRRFDESELASIDVDVPDLVPGADRVVGVPGISAGELVLFFAAHPGQSTFLLPRAQGDFEGSRRWALAVASNDTLQSVTLVRADVGDDIERLAPPAPDELPQFTTGELALDRVGGYAAVEVHESSATTYVFDARPEVQCASGCSFVAWHAPSSEEVSLSNLRQNFSGWISGTVQPR